MQGIMIPLSSSTSQRKSSVAAKMTSGSSSGANTAASIMTKLKGAIRAVVSDSNARNLMGFLVLNFAFAFVELAYGIWTNSLGLISDSFHMFFDCTGLVAGLAAQVVSRWPADDSYAYGYKRAEVLAGFVNALFLLFIAFFILTEAVERAIEPPEVHHDRLFLVSVLGLLVNLVGIYVFQHGGSHGHSHGGSGSSHGHSHGSSDNHGHSHGNHGHSHDDGQLVEDPYHPHHQVSISMGGHQQNNTLPPPSSTTQNNQNHLMKGVLLHILADTLGSVGVVISALLMRAFGWMRADPVCSIFIAVLVAASVWGLLRDSARILMMRTPVELDDERRALNACYSRLHRYHPAVMGIQEPRFWTLCADSYAGSIKIEVRSGFINGSGTGTNATNNSTSLSLSSSTLQLNSQSNQSIDHFAAGIMHDRDQFANNLVRYAQQVFGAVGVRQLYVQIDYTVDDTISGGGSLLNHDPQHHIINNTQRQNNYVNATGNLLEQQNQQQIQFQTYNSQFQQQQQQQYTNPLLMM